MINIRIATKYTEFQLNYRDQLMLKDMFPLIEWEKLSFCKGIPFYMRLSKAIATALPNAFSKDKIIIYIKDYDLINPDNRLAIIVHELVHVHQYQALTRSKSLFFPEFGFFRSFLTHYLAWYIQCFLNNLFLKKLSFQQASFEAYRFQPFEQEAYLFEHQFRLALPQYKAHESAVFYRLFPSIILKDAIPINSPSKFILIFAALINLILFFFNLIFSSFNWLFCLFRKN